jgi:trehalose 6-phosphate phosphatase
VSTSPPAPQPGWAYFFDVDGTLADFADTPGGVRVGTELKRLLEQLYQATGGAVALISGRPITDMDRLFPGVRMPVAGQHGVERRDAAGVLTRHAFPTERFDRAYRKLAAAVAGKRGLLLENKGLSVALHYRRAPRLAGYAHRLARSVLPSLGGEGRFSIQTGKRVVEMKPAGKDKGAAVMEFMQEAPFRGRTAVFVGDDATDEFGFATVNKIRGHSIKVGPGRTVARWRLRNVRAVQEWLTT